MRGDKAIGAIVNLGSRSTYISPFLHFAFFVFFIMTLIITCFSSCCFGMGITTCTTRLGSEIQLSSWAYHRIIIILRSSQPPYHFHLHTAPDATKRIHGSQLLFPPLQAPIEVPAPLNMGLMPLTNAVRRHLRAVPNKGHSCQPEHSSQTMLLFFSFSQHHRTSIASPGDRGTSLDFRPSVFRQLPPTHNNLDILSQPLYFAHNIQNLQRHFIHIHYPLLFPTSHIIAASATPSNSTDPRNYLTKSRANFSLWNNMAIHHHPELFSHLDERDGRDG